jgi:hypothetical protein
MIIETPDRLAIHEPSALLVATAMAEGGVAIKVDGRTAYLDQMAAITLMAWLSEATK